MGSHELAARLRLIVVTDARLAVPRDLLDVVTAALAAGAPAIQLREKGATANELYPLGLELRRLTREHGALLLVNDRLDLALAVDADGVHLGDDDLPVDAVRAHAPSGFLIGRSADDANGARDAVAAGADYIGCGTVYATATKPDAGEVIGLAGLARVASAVEVPVVGIGGITVERAAEVVGAGGAGVAVVGAVMGAEDVGGAVRGLLGAFR